MFKNFCLKVFSSLGHYIVGDSVFITCIHVFRTIYLFHIWYTVNISAIVVDQKFPEVHHWKVANFLWFRMTLFCILTNLRTERRATIKWRSNQGHVQPKQFEWPILLVSKVESNFIQRCDKPMRTVSKPTAGMSLFWQDTRLTSRRLRMPRSTVQFWVPHF